MRRPHRPNPPMNAHLQDHVGAKRLVEEYGYRQRGRFRFATISDNSHGSGYRKNNKHFYSDGLLAFPTLYSWRSTDAEGAERTAGDGVRRRRCCCCLIACTQFARPICRWTSITLGATSVASVGTSAKGSLSLSLSLACPALLPFSESQRRARSLPARVVHMCRHSHRG